MKENRLLVSGNHKRSESKIPISKEERKKYFKKIKQKKNLAKRALRCNKPNIKLSWMNLLRWRVYDKRIQLYGSTQDLMYSHERKVKISRIKLQKIEKISTLRSKMYREIKSNISVWKRTTSADDTIKSVKNEILEYKRVFNSKKCALKNNFRNKMISKKAYLDETTKGGYELSYKISVAKEKLERNRAFKKIIETFLKYKKEIKKEKSIIESKVVFIASEIPNDEKFTARRFVSPMLEFVFPGLGSLLNHELMKAVLLLIITIVVYGTTILFCTGTINIDINGTKQGDGLLGLVTLGAHSSQYQPDSRFFLIFGILSVIFIGISLVYGTLMSKIAYKKSLALYLGCDNARFISTKRYLQSNGFPYLIASPVYLIITFTTIFPLLTSMIIVFTNYGSKGHVAPAQLIQWVGLENLRKVFDFNGAEGHYFLKTLSWSFIWGIGSSLTSVGSGTALAILVNHPKLKGKRFVRMLFLLPMAIPFFIIVLYFKIFFGPTGSMNHDIVRAFVPWHEITKYEISPGHWEIYADQNWFSDVVTVKSLLFVLNVWLNFSGTFLFISGLLHGIPADLYEAAEVAGAGGYKKFTKITGPILMYRIAPILISAFIGGFNNFGLIYLFVEGGPHVSVGGPGETDILASYVFSLVQKQGKPAVAAAYMFIISFAFGGVGLLGFSRTKIFRGGKIKRKFLGRARKHVKK